MIQCKQLLNNSTLNMFVVSSMRSGLQPLRCICTVALLVLCREIQSLRGNFALLDEERVTAVEVHLHGCSTCAREIQSLRETLRLTEEGKGCPFPPSFLITLREMSTNVWRQNLRSPSERLSSRNFLLLFDCPL